jgi:cobalt-zinc-cadmium resistance protein CzcA
MQQSLERAILELPEVANTFARVGTAEVATDPMPPSVADGFVMMKPRSAWPDPDKPRAQFIAELDRAIGAVPGSNYEISQPIQLRFNELISGVRSDLGVKLYGDDPAVLLAQGRRIASVLGTVPGASGVKVEQIAGLPVLEVIPRRDALARAGIHVRELQDVVVTAIGGREAGHIFEGDRRFDIVVRLPEELRSNIRALERLPVRLPDARGFMPLAELAEIRETTGPNQISRENGKRRLVITANVEGRDLGGFVRAARAAIFERVKLPAGLLDRIRRHVRAARIGHVAPRGAGARDIAADLRAADDDLRLGARRAAGVQRRAAGAGRRHRRAGIAWHPAVDHRRRGLHHAVGRGRAHRRHHGHRVP